MKQRIDFRNTGQDYSAWNDALTWCKQNGYSAGPMQVGSPVGIAKGDADIAKWRNLTRHDREQLDGVIIGCFKTGTVTIQFDKWDQ